MGRGTTGKCSGRGLRGQGVAVPSAPLSRLKAIVVVVNAVDVHDNKIETTTAPTKLPSTSAPAAATEAPTLPAPTADTSAQAAVDESTAAPAEASRPVFLDFYAPW